jgi:hypothetical protein
MGMIGYASTSLELVCDTADSAWISKLMRRDDIDAPTCLLCLSMPYYRP